MEPGYANIFKDIIGTSSLIHIGLRREETQSFSRKNVSRASTVVAVLLQKVFSQKTMLGADESKENFHSFRY